MRWAPFLQNLDKRACGVIGPGDFQWMTAASGIVHEEFHSEAYAKKGGAFEMPQLWVNRPAKDKSAPAGYQTIVNADIRDVALDDDAGRLRVIADGYGKAKGPAKTVTPINIWDVQMKGGKSVALDVPEGHSLTVLVFSGVVEINGKEIVRAGQTVVLSRDGGGVEIEANGDAKLLVLTGKPIDEPVFAYGPFVLNTEDEIRKAISDFNAGKFGRIDS